MKYGKQLALRSTPEWACYNIDYDRVKRLIKKNTQVRPMAVPALGSPDAEFDCNPEFTQELQSALQQEFEQIEMFVQTRLVELDSKIAALSRRVTALSIRYPPTPRSSIPFRRLERLSLLEGDILEAGVLLRKLSRFISAQRTAFVKLLKKYTKWSGNREMPSRFRREYMSTVDSSQFLHPDFLSTRFESWLATLLDLRSLVLSSDDEQGSVPEIPAVNILASDSIRTRSSSPQIVASPTHENVSSITTIDEFDFRFDQLDLSQSGDLKPGKPVRQTYWVHPENFIELQVLLNHHFRLLSETNLASRPTHSRAPSTASVLSSIRGNLTRQQSSTGLGSNDSLMNFLLLTGAEGSKLKKYPEGIARWIGDQNRLSLLVRKLTFKKRSWEQIGLQLPVDEFEKVLERGSDYTSKSRCLQNAHPHLESMEPVTFLRCQRSRYSGLHNSSEAAIYASLDRSITFADDYGGGIPDVSALKYSSFPYVVFTVWYDGTSNESGFNESLVKLLGDSTLTYKVEGFSTFKHAIWLQQKSVQQPPPWASLLNEDIRSRPIFQTSESSSTPSRPLASRSLDNSSLLSPSVRKSYTNTSYTTEDTAFDSSPSQLTPRSGRRRFDREIKRVRQERYWSEYDNPDECSGDEEGAYVIYIDPDAPSIFDHWIEWWNRLFGTENSTTEERETLLGGSTEDLERSVRRASTSSHQIRVLHPQGHLQPVSTLLDHLASASESQVRITVYSSLALLSISVLLSVLSLVLLTSARRKLHVQTTIIALIGVFISICVALSGAVLGFGALKSSKRMVQEQSGEELGQARQGEPIVLTGARRVMFRIVVGLITPVSIGINMACVYWAISVY